MTSLDTAINSRSEALNVFSIIGLWLEATGISTSTYMHTIKDLRHSCNILWLKIPLYWNISIWRGSYFALTLGKKTCIIVFTTFDYILIEHFIQKKYFIRTFIERIFIDVNIIESLCIWLLSKLGKTWILIEITFFQPKS